MKQLMTIDQFGVTELKGVPVVSSRFVAENFNKQHSHVLRDIGTALENFSSIGQSKFGESNFIESAYRNEQNKKQPEYLLTRDGFSYIAMGFTGIKAAGFKIAYIERFNQMEQFIKDLLEAKSDFPEFTDAIMSAHEEPKHYHFSNELNMINQIVTGMNAKQFKEVRGLDKSISSIRPHLHPLELQAIKTLQRVDIGMILTTPDFQDRKTRLTEYYNRMKIKRLSA